MTEPITITDVENQLRIGDLSDESVLVQDIYIPAVRQRAEAITRRAIVETTEVLVLDCFPEIIVLRKPPLISVTEIKFINTEGIEIVLDPLAYRVIKSKTKPEMLSYIIPTYGMNWPETRDDFATVEVTYNCGYTPETCPEPIKQWMLLNVASLYENRESVVTSGKGGVVLDLNKTLADGLIENYRIARL